MRSGPPYPEGGAGLEDVSVREQHRRGPLAKVERAIARAQVAKLVALIGLVDLRVLPRDEGIGELAHRVSANGQGRGLERVDRGLDEGLRGGPEADEPGPGADPAGGTGVVVLEPSCLLACHL